MQGATDREPIDETSDAKAAAQKKSLDKSGVAA